MNAFASILPTLFLLSVASASLFAAESGPHGPPAADLSVTSHPPVWEKMVDDAVTLVAASAEPVAEYLRLQDETDDPLVFLKATANRIHVAYAGRPPADARFGSDTVALVAYLPTKYRVNEATSGLEPGTDVDLVAVLTVLTRHQPSDAKRSTEGRIQAISLEGLWPTDAEGNKSRAEHIAKLVAML